jgi:hypothetical protein
VSEQSPEAPSSPLFEFCSECVSRHSDNWPPTECDLAVDFVCTFDVLPVLSQAQIETLCFQLGIKVSFRALPPELPGHNGSYENENTIELNEKEIVFGGMTHTFFHEIRECMERNFSVLQHPVIAENELEKRADLFAAFVRINCIHKTLGDLIGGIEDISSTLLRWGAYALLFAGGLVYGVGCLSLPQQEDYISRNK